MTIALKTQKQILASQLNNRINERIEEALKQDIQQFFGTLKNKVLASFDEYYNETLLLQGHVNLILSPIHEAHKDYYDLLLSKNLEMFRRGSLQAERLVNRLEQSSMKAAKPVKFKHKEEEHFGTLKYSEDFLSDYTFVATDKTLSRIDKDINKILTEGYRDGWGVKDVRNRIMERYDQFKGWEANRIARTEMQTAHNMGMMNGYESQGVEYIEWRSAIHQPKRTRKSHLKLNGEIIPFGGTFSNDLAFPGDKSGEIEEWINCRCSVVPFIIPLGYEAPSFWPFFEKDLVKVGSTDPKDYLNLPSETIETVEIIPSVEESAEEFTNPANISKEEAKEILHFKKRRDKNKIEYGNLIETETGKKIYDEDIRGKKGQITIPRPSGKNYSLIHNHPSHKPFSGGDIKNFVGYSNEVRCIATNPNGAYVATPTKQLKWSKENGSLYESNTAYELMYKVDRIHREAQIELYENKWKAKMQNAKSRKEFNQLKQEWQEESAELIHERILEEFGPGKNEYVEIHFYTNEELEHVIKNSN